jgi:hypothetical protein
MKGLQESLRALQADEKETANECISKCPPNDKDCVKNCKDMAKNPELKGMKNRLKELKRLNPKNKYDPLIYELKEHIKKLDPRSWFKRDKNTPDDIINEYMNSDSAINEKISSTNPTIGQKIRNFSQEDLDAMFIEPLIPFTIKSDMVEQTGSTFAADDMIEDQAMNDSNVSDLVDNPNINPDTNV